MTPRLEQTAEALGDVRRLFYEPGAFGDCSLSDVAESLAASSRSASGGTTRLSDRVHAMVRRTWPATPGSPATPREPSSKARQALGQIRPSTLSLWCRTPTPHALPVALRKTRSPRASIVQEARNWRSWAPVPEQTRRRRHERRNGRAMKAKGSAFERQVAEYLRDHGHPHAERAYGAGRPADVGDLDGLPGYVVECKCHRTIDLAGFMHEAVAEAANVGPDIVPVVIAKRRNRPIRDATWSCACATGRSSSGRPTMPGTRRDPGHLSRRATPPP